MRRLRVGVVVEVVEQTGALHDAFLLGEGAATVRLAVAGGAFACGRLQRRQRVGGGEQDHVQAALVARGDRHVARVHLEAVQDAGRVAHDDELSIAGEQRLVQGAGQQCETYAAACCYGGGGGRRRCAAGGRSVIVVTRRRVATDVENIDGLRQRLGEVPQRDLARGRDGEEDGGVRR